MKLSIMIPYSISKKILHREHKMHQKLQLVTKSSQASRNTKETFILHYYSNKIKSILS